jgi:hypothetical protein
MDKIITFEGGGYSGCFNEINIAFYNSKSKAAYADKWEPIFITGDIGKRNFEALKSKTYVPEARSRYENEIKAVRNPRTKKWEFDLDVIINNYSACCCSRIAAKFGPDNDDYALLVTCSDCKKKFDILNTDEGVFQLDGVHGIGGLASQADDIVCPSCVSIRECQGCNELCRDDKAQAALGVCTDCLQRILDNEEAVRKLSYYDIDMERALSYIQSQLELETIEDLYKLLLIGGEALEDAIDNYPKWDANVVRGLLAVFGLDDVIKAEAAIQRLRLEALGFKQMTVSEIGG